MLNNNKIIASAIFIAMSLLSSGCNESNTNDNNASNGNSSTAGNNASNGNGSTVENSSSNGNSSTAGNNASNGNGSSNIQVDENGTTTVNGTSIISNIPEENLSEAETKSLLFVREEEKLARDVYLGLNILWGDQVKNFLNISKAEQTHTDSVKALLDRYNLTDPVTESEDQNLGVFQDLELQSLYDSLMAKGKISLVDALQVGATVEDYDIFDIEEHMKNVDNADILAVYDGLVKGSENHLRAFSKKLAEQNSSYTTSYISAERYELILSSSNSGGDHNDTNTTDTVATNTTTDSTSTNGNSSNGNGTATGSGTGNGSGSGNGNGNGTGLGSGNGNN